MFKELGYKCELSLGDFEYYNNDIDIEITTYNNNDKQIIIRNWWSDERITIVMPTLKAIIKQCDELGWLDE